MDASAFIHRAFYALRKFTNREGIPTGAAYGFTNTLIKLFKDKNPQYLAIVYDSHGPTRRHEIYKDYKANRPAMDPDLAVQIPYIHEIVKALGFFSVELPGHEADDLIAAYTRRYAAEGRPVVLVTGDKDFYQLLSDKVSMYDPDPTKSSALTLETFQERFQGLTPASFLDVQALMGDSSDNIPGIPKVGEKTALKLIGEFKSLSELYERIQEVRPLTLQKRLLEFQDSALLSRKLAYLGDGVEDTRPYTDLSLGTANLPALQEIFQELEFNRLLKDIQEFSILRIENEPISPTQPEIGPPDTILVTTPETWEILEKTLENSANLAVQIITPTPEVDTPGPLVGLSIATDPKTAFYIPLAHTGLESSVLNQDLNQSLEILKPYLTNPAKKIFGITLKNTWLTLARHGLRLPPPAGDPTLASYLINPDSANGFSALANFYLHYGTHNYKIHLNKTLTSFADLNLVYASQYAGEITGLTLKLVEYLDTTIQESPKLSDLYHHVELPLENLLVSMEEYGVLIDPVALNKISAKLGEDLANLEKEIFQMAGLTFNVASPRQVGEVLFQTLGLPTGKKTAKKTGYSTDNEVLTDLSLLYPIAGLILRHREISKLKSTYTDRLPESINPKTGRIHSSFNQALTATGRLSSSDPNLQNIPAKTPEGQKIREAFIAPEGYKLISSDYSQIELRVMAAFSCDLSLLSAFQYDQDIHRETASLIFNIPLHTVGPSERRQAKAINFGIIYGQGPFGLARQLKISQGQARDFIELYFKRFPGVKDFMDKMKQIAANKGFVETMFGRRRYLPGIRSRKAPERFEAERMAINTPIQGTAADIIKIAMLRVHARLEKESPKSRLILQVHDELIVETPDADVEIVKTILTEEMIAAGNVPFFPGAPALAVPLKVDQSVSQNWSHT
jgi:DNA polymerase-1